MDRIDINLNSTQGRFIADDSRVTGMFGGLGNGKTFAGCLKGILRIVNPDEPPQLGLIARQTYPELRDSTQRTFIELLTMFGFKPGIHYNHYKQENRIKFKNGHEVLFRSLDDPAKLLSINLGWYYIDQAEEVSEEVFLTLLGRLRAVNEPKAWITGNPLGHNWVWHRFIHEPIDGNVMHMASSMENNDNIPPDYIDTLIKNYNEIWVNRYIHGSWDAFEGQIYPDYDEKVHVVPDMVPPHEWMRIISIDHGRTNPTAVLWGAMDNDDVLWIYREHYEAGKDIDYHAKIIKAYQGEGSREAYIIDPSTGAGKLDDPETIGNRYRNMGIPVANGNNQVQGGIDKVTEYFKKNKIKICNSCINLKREVINYQWEQPSASRIDLNAPEKPLKKDDHAMDSLRYNIWFAYDRQSKPPPKTDTQSVIDELVMVHEADEKAWDSL